MAHEHSQATTTLNRTQSTATVTFRGLALFCFSEQSHCEAVFLRHSHHKFDLTVIKVGPDGSETSLDHQLDTSRDIKISVLNPVISGVHRYEPGEFNRKANIGDEQDFRWVVDVEGIELHDVDLTQQVPGSDTQVRGLSRLRLSDVTLYTKAPSADPYARIRDDAQHEPPTFFGRIAEVIGADIACGDGGGVFLMNEGIEESKMWLPKEGGVKYEIDISNGCSGASSPGDASDFVLYYDVMSDHRGIRYDFEIAVSRGDPRASELTLDESGGWFRDGPRIVCDPAYLGRTSTLPTSS